MLGNLAVIENHNAESFVAVVVMWLRVIGQNLHRGYIIEGDQCYGVNIDDMALTTQFKLDAVFSH